MRSDPRVQFGREAEKYLSSKAHNDSGALAGLTALVPSGIGRALDVGTGAGHMAFALASRAAAVVALDPTPEMLDIVKREARSRHLDCLNCVLAVAESLPFREGSFDALACRVAAHHFEGPAEFVRESVRVLKPGGVFLLVDTVAPEDSAADAGLNRIETVRDPSHRRDWRVKEWKSMAEGAGLDVDTVYERSKPLDFQDWMERMSVSEGDQEWLRSAVSDASGALGDYLAYDGRMFHLREMTLLGRKVGGS